MKPKRKRSPHQQQIRFFIGLGICLIVVVTVLLFWLMDRPGYSLH